METIITISDIKGLIRRRMKLFILFFSLIMTGAIIIAVALPPIYRSQAVILVEAQQIPDAFVKSTITSVAEQRMEIVTRDILKYSTLQQIIEEFGLYPENREKGDMGAAVRKMQDAVEVEPISTKAGVKSVTVAFNLSYENKDPQKAYAVADRLSKLYLQKETEQRENQAAVTTRFMEAELQNLKQRIEKHEKIVSEFKQQHTGELPGSIDANNSTLQRLDRELDQTNDRIRSLEDRKIYLKGQLANIEPLKPILTSTGKVASNPSERLKELRLELIRLRSRLSEKHPDVRKLINEIAELEGQTGSADVAVAKVKQLRALRSQLRELQASKGAKHPDVVHLSSEVDDLSREVDRLLTDKTMANVSEQRPDNPQYIDLTTQIFSADTEIKNLKKDVTRISALIEEYQKKVEQAPIVEQEYNELTLDYANAKQRYNEVLSKLLEARVAQEMEIQQQGERFAITDPAYLPTRPSKPNRLAIMLLGFVMATGAALGAAAFREATDHTIKSSKDIDKFDGIELLTAMPYTPTKEERRQQLNKRLVLTTSCIGIFGVVLMVFNWLVLPLRDVFSIVLKRLTF